MSTAGLSEVRLANMHTIMAGYVERGEVPGLVTLVSRRGVVHVDVIGKQTIGMSSPMQRNTIFRISSMTKPITAVAAMILVEECKLRLDEPVDALLPELAERKVLKRLDRAIDDTVPAKRPITVRDLLTFRMGFGQMMAPPEAYPILSAANEQQIGMGPPSPSQMPTPDEWIRRLGQLPLMYQPGEQWMYNTGSDVLGVVKRSQHEQYMERVVLTFAPNHQSVKSFLSGTVQQMKTKNLSQETPMPEKNYRDRGILEKLGIQPGHVVAFAHEAQEIDPNLSQSILERTGLFPTTKDEAFDIVLAVIDETTDAVEVLKKWREQLAPSGGIWLLTAKRGQLGYVDQRELIAAGQQAGVVDNKVCSVSPTLSAIRFVIRKKDRSI